MNSQKLNEFVTLALANGGANFLGMAYLKAYNHSARGDAEIIAACRTAVETIMQMVDPVPVEPEPVPVEAEPEPADYFRSAMNTQTEQAQASRFDMLEL